MDNLLKIIKFIAEYGYIWMSIITIIVAISIYKYKEEDEDYFILKIIGFYLLGAFNINFKGLNEIYVYLPLGYLIYYYFMKKKNRLNKIAKDKYAKLGLLILCITFINNTVYNYLEYRDVSMNSPCKIENLNKEWEKIKDKCYIENNTLLTNARVLYDEGGNIKNLNYYIVDYYKNKSYYISIKNNKYIVEVEKYDYEVDFASHVNINAKDYITMEDFLEVTNFVSSKNFYKNKKLNYNDITYSYDSYNKNEEYLEDDPVYAVYRNKEKLKYEKLDVKNLYIDGPIINLYSNTKGEEYKSANFAFGFKYDE